MYGSGFNPRMGRPGGAMGMGRMGPMGRMDVARGGMDMGFGAPMEMSRGTMDLGRGGMGPAMAAGPVDDVGNVTNDPTTIHCRVFVGNLNTHLMTKEDVERIFCNYGIVTGISMHKGYAFVQYTNTRDARRAATLEDGKFYANMRLDCNVASEPKNTGRGQKRAGTVTTLNRQTSGGGNPNWAGAGPPNKKVRTDVNPSMKRTLVTISSESSTPAKTMVKKAVATSLAKPKVPSLAAKQATATTALNTSSGDILICGRCRAMFPNVHRLAMHKKVQCVVKTNCKCQTQNVQDLEPTPLTCAKCTLSFASAWDLLQHCQAEHSMAIFKAVGQAKKPSPDKSIKTEPKQKSEGVNGDEIDEALEETLLSDNPAEGGDN